MEDARGRNTTATFVGHRSPRSGSRSASPTEARLARAPKSALREDAPATCSTLCVSPVPEGAQRGMRRARHDRLSIGDPTLHSLIGYVNEPARAPAPSGTGPRAPRTRRRARSSRANAFLYGAGLETLSTFGRDIVAPPQRRYLLRGGDRRGCAVVEAWVARLRRGPRGRSSRVGRPHSHVVDGRRLRTWSVSTSAMDFSWLPTASADGASERGASALALRDAWRCVEAVRLRSPRDDGRATATFVNHDGHVHSSAPEPPSAPRSSRMLTTQ